MRDQIIGALIALCIVSLGGLPSPARADECKTPAIVITTVTGIIRSYGQSIRWEIREPEGDRQLIISVINTDPPEIHLFMNGCYVKTIQGPVLMIPRAAA